MQQGKEYNRKTTLWQLQNISKIAAIKPSQNKNGYIPKDMSKLLEITRGYI